jgi:hypothetical protein
MLEERTQLDWKQFAPAENDLKAVEDVGLVAYSLKHENHRDTAKTFPNFTPQYSDVYKVRLKQLEEPFLKVKHVELSKMKEGQRCSVIGCMFKVMKSRKSYVKAIEEGETLKEETEFDDLEPRDDDEFYIENSTGKRMLNLENAVLCLEGGRTIKATVHSLFSGMIVRLDCCLLSENEVQVFEVNLPGIVPFPTTKDARLPPPDEDNPSIAHLLQKIAASQNPRLVALVSGVELDPQAEEVINDVSLLRDFLLGNIASDSLKLLLNCIQTVVFTGNYIPSDKRINKQLLRCYEYKDRQQAILDKINKGMRAADELIGALTKKYNVIAMPGQADVTDSFLPQHAIPSFCFPMAKKSGRLSMVSNPASFSLLGRNFMATDGANIQTLLSLTKELDDELDALEITLNARHFAPNCPESTPCFPGILKDELVIDRPCHFFICGAAKKLLSKTVRGDDHAVKLIAVPAFSKTRSIVLLDVDSMETFELAFGSSPN